MPCGRPGTKVKICGVTRSEDVRACLDAGVDFVGFNVWPHSPRHVDVETARALARDLPAWCTPVAVCVWSHAESVEAALETGLDWIQVHDTPHDWRWTEAEASHTIVRAMRADHTLEPRELTGAHFYLVDTPTATQGGSGRTFDWALLEPVRGDERLIVAGGLSAENVGDAIAATRPYAVDVASGVESAPGLKDAERIHAFVRAVAGEGEVA